MSPRSKIDPFGSRYDIRREGHPITGGAERLMTVPKVEMTDGRVFNSDEARLHVLARRRTADGCTAAPPNRAPRKLYDLSRPHQPDVYAGPQQLSAAQGVAEQHPPQTAWSQVEARLHQLDRHDTLFTACRDAGHLA